MPSPSASVRPFARSRARDPVIQIISICGAGLACGAIVGFWRSALVQCGIQPSLVQYGVCPLQFGPVVTFLSVLTVAAVALAVAAGTGRWPIVASIAGAILVVGAFLFPYGFAFADLGIGGWVPWIPLGGMLTLGGAAGFLEVLRYQEAGRLPTVSFNSLTVGGALIAFSGACTYWLPQNLSGGMICHGPAGGLGCLPNAAPLIPEAFAIGLVALGIGVASPVLLPRWPEVGFVCTVGAAFAAFFALLNGSLFLVAIALGLGSILAFEGVVPRMVRLFRVDRSPAKRPPLYARRGSS